MHHNLSDNFSTTLISESLAPNFVLRGKNQNMERQASCIKTDNAMDCLQALQSINLVIRLIPLIIRKIGLPLLLAPFARVNLPQISGHVQYAKHSS